VSSSCRIVELPRIRDPRGSLTFIEAERHVPFRIARSYWIYDVPGGETRGGHAYHELEELLVALSGSFDVVVDDGSGPERHVLNRSYFGLYVPPMVWRTVENFSTNAVALVLASRHFDEADYVRDPARFAQLVAGGAK
jgi:glyoxylate utilization-related uncharacterized protein